ncbi:three-Cys-motif partner protein TcmP [Hoeflea alexandrii]
MDDEKHFFGSSETERKLACLRDYLTAYSTALKAKNFTRIYIDAFAGTGSRTETRAVLPFFDQSEPKVEEVTTPGSATIALDVKPPFHSILLIEKDPQKAAVLRKLVATHSHGRAHVREGDANEIVQRLCRKYDWQREGRRGVIFLDPFGMEVCWETVEAIAKTEALDCWYFFPLSGLYRNAPKDPNRLDQSKIDAISRVFGSDKWRTEWYQGVDDQYDLLGEPINFERRMASVDRIEMWVQKHLESVFKGAVLKPLRLNHPGGAPMASLFFAVANPSPAAVGPATRIANHILKVGSSSQVRSR